MMILKIIIGLLYIVNLNEIITLTFQKKNPVMLSWVLMGVYLFLCGSETFLPEGHALFPLLIIVKWLMPALIILSIHHNIVKQVIYITFFFLTCDSIIDALGTLFVNVVFSLEKDALILNVFPLLFNLLVFAVVKQLQKTKKDEIQYCIGLLSTKIYVLLFISFFTVGVLSGFFSAGSISFPIYNNIINIMIIATVSFFIVVMICMVSNCISQSYFKSTSDLLNRQVEMQIENFTKTEKLNKSIREFKHDYKNHMICIQAYLNENRVEDAKRYIADLNDHIDISSSEYHSGNHIADILLNEKNELAQRCRCSIKYSGIISDSISAFNICTILSNSLDNAIEACAKISSEEEMLIEVTATLENNIQMLRIKNPNDHELKNEKTSKSDKLNHGIGLYNIKKTAEKLDGRMNITQKIPFFILEIEFPVNSAAENI